MANTPFADVDDYARREAWRLGRANIVQKLTIQGLAVTPVRMDGRFVKKFDFGLALLVESRLSHLRSPQHRAGLR